MTDRQRLAFEAGSGATPNELLIAIASITIIAALLWTVWVTLGAFKAWHDGDLTFFDLVWSALRACIVLMVLGFYIR